MLTVGIDEVGERKPRFSPSAIRLNTETDRMSGAQEPIRKRRPPKTFLISTDTKIQDQLEGTIRLQRGYMCQDQDAEKNRGDSLWVKVLDNGFMVKLERKFLLEVPSELSGLLEPVSDPDTRLKLFTNPGKLQYYATLPVDAPLWVQIGQPDELAEAELKYIGPLTRGSSAVFFGVQLKGSAAGRGVSNGSFKGHRLFNCPEACALFLPRVCFPLEDTVVYGEVRFCGLLPGRPSSGMYVGVLLDSPVGSWNGHYKGEKLCHIPSPIYGLLLPVTKVSSEPKFHHHNPPHQIPKPVLKPTQPPVINPAPVSPPVVKVALIPPNKQPVKPLPLPPPKPTQKPLPTPPLPPPKPQSPTSPTAADQLQHTNGIHRPPSPLRSPGNDEAARENDNVGVEGELEVGSMVEVNDPPLFGVIRWIGRIAGISEPVAGIELDQELSAGTDGSYLGERHFRCPANKGLFVKLRNCRRDSRFPAPETPVNQVERCNSIAFAEWGSERVEEHTPPVDGDEGRELYQGWKRGIQGHLNSCYLDATLFSLFSCCSSADWVLFWPSDPKIDHNSSQAQDLLRCEIVNPLRRYGYVCASKTMALRRLLEAANSDTGFTNQEKDPEEFLNKLFQLLRSSRSSRLDR
ncbi:hypothetical protein Q5P01_002424 [Channa striata]|uniref:ubiquitinyl hydrolase 1 n=1 Tax=Channa striata TaxID=64152 RepID=A0AA88T3Q7_CHASR|nr:hypothetical protein Q5P01_002424 [Channa striata]